MSTDICHECKEPQTHATQEGLLVCADCVATALQQKNLTIESGLMETVQNGMFFIIFQLLYSPTHFISYSLFALAIFPPELKGPPKPVRSFVPSAISRAISSLSDSEYERLFFREIVISDHTKRNRAWAKKTYEEYVEKINAKDGRNLQPFPVDSIIVSSFIKCVGTTGTFTLETIKSTLVSGIKAAHKELTGASISKEISESINMALKVVNKHPKCRRGGEGKEPAIAEDVLKIIDMTPDGVKCKAREAACWLMGLCTGARAITLSNVLLKDIIEIRKSDRLPGVEIVQINYEVTKGCTNWKQPVCLEGNTSHRHSGNVLYWLNEWLKQRFSVDLYTISTWPANIKEAKLFDWKEDAMSVCFATRSQAAGFPRGMHSLHSLRSGFICSFSMLAGEDECSRKAVLEITGMVGGKHVY